MIQEIRSFEPYEGFIGELSADPLYADPHFTNNRNNLYNAIKRNDERVFAVLNHGTIEGLFVWLILPEEQFIEMIIGFTRHAAAFSEMLSFMEKNYAGFKIDIVFNPLNQAISRPLKEKGAAFDAEQQKMLHKGRWPNISTAPITPYSEKWKEQYCMLHRKEAYWTAERVLAAQDRFRVLLAVRDGQVQGYLDVTRCYDENEIYDLFVKPESAGQGYELALVMAAVKWNGEHPLMVLVDVNAKDEIELYAKAGFEKAAGHNSVLSSYQAKKA